MFFKKSSSIQKPRISLYVWPDIKVFFVSYSTTQRYIGYIHRYRRKYLFPSFIEVHVLVFSKVFKVLVRELKMILEFIGTIKCLHLFLKILIL